MLDDSVHAQLAAILPSAALLTSPEDTRPYECDGLTLFRERPAAVRGGGEATLRRRERRDEDGAVFGEFGAGHGCGLALGTSRRDAYFDRGDASPERETPHVRP